MANYEIDSFVKKFKALCQAGRSASLNLSSCAEKASLNLCLDLGALQDGPHHPPNHSRNGPSRQRRREKRAAARVADAEEAVAALSVEEREVLEIAEETVSKSPVKASNVPGKGSEEAAIEKVEVVKPTATKASEAEVVDEVCTDSEYESRTPQKDTEDPSAKHNLVEVQFKHPKPPPVRDWSCGGIKYYRITYEDPTDDEDENIC
jgi:hypothetical protein